MSENTVADICQTREVNVIAEPGYKRRHLRDRFDSELPVFLVTGDSIWHTQVWGATHTDDEAPAYRLQ